MWAFVRYVFLFIYLFISFFKFIYYLFFGIMLLAGQTFLRELTRRHFMQKIKLHFSQPFQCLYSTLI